MQIESQKEKENEHKSAVNFDFWPDQLSCTARWRGFGGLVGADTTSYVMEDKELIVGDYWHHDGLCKHTCLHSCLLFLFPFPSISFLIFTCSIGQSHCPRKEISPSFFVHTKDWMEIESKI